MGAYRARADAHHRAVLPLGTDEEIAEPNARATVSGACVTSPLPAGTAPGAGATPIDQSFVQAIAGVVRQPRSTFQRAVSHPRWVLLLLVTTLASAASGVALMETAVGRQALVEQWERTATAFGRPLDDRRYERLQELSERGGVGYAVANALISGPVLAIGVALALRLIFRGDATFRQVMTVTTYAGVILAVRQLVAAPVSYVRESTSSATTLASWFSMGDEASPVARFLGALDVFVIWWAVVLAIGVSVLYRRRARTVAVTFVGIYAALAVLLAIVMAITGGSA